MRTLRLTALIALVAAVTLGVGVSSAFASATGNITGGRLDDHGFVLKFNVGGTPTHGHGHFRYQQPPELGEYAFSGKVTCYYQEAGPAGGMRAMFGGPITSLTPGFTEDFFLASVADGDPRLRGGDSFDVGTSVGIPPPGWCAENVSFPYDDPDPEFRVRLPYVETGDIVIR